MINLNTLIISDTHFNHKGMLKASKKRQSVAESIEDLDNLLWRNLSKIQNKTILHLGDLTWSGGTAKHLLPNIEALSSKVLFIPGNHDKNSIGTYKKGFNEVFTGINNLTKQQVFLNKESEFLNCIILDIQDIRILFSHYPVFDDCEYDKKTKFYPAILNLREIFEELKCDLNIHGHTHEKTISKKSYNCSVENINFKPKKLEDILKEKGLI